MAHFARIDENNLVQQVIVIDNKHALTEEAGVAFIKDVLKFDGTWLQTSYNANFRGKYAAFMDIYDTEKNEFKDNMEYREKREKMIAEQDAIANEKINQQKTLAAKMGLTIEELQTILKP